MWSRRGDGTCVQSNLCQRQERHQMFVVFFAQIRLNTFCTNLSKLNVTDALQSASAPTPEMTELRMLVAWLDRWTNVGQMLDKCQQISWDVRWFLDPSDLANDMCNGSVAACWKNMVYHWTQTQPRRSFLFMILSSVSKTRLVLNILKYEICR